MIKINLLGDSGPKSNETTTISNLGLINLKPLLDVDASTNTQELWPGADGVSGYSFIRLSPVTSEIDEYIKPENIKKGVSILGVEGNIEIKPTQEKSMDITENGQYELTPDEGYILDKGNISVNVDLHTQEKTMSANRFVQDGNYMDPIEIIPDEGYSGLSKVTVESVGLLNLNITPSTSTQDFNNSPSSTDYLGYRNVHVNAVDKSIDENIKPENIKKGVSILGVEGTAEAPKESEYSFMVRIEFLPHNTTEESDGQYVDVSKFIYKKVIMTIPLATAKEYVSKIDLTTDPNDVITIYDGTNAIDTDLYKLIYNENDKRTYLYASTSDKMDSSHGMNVSFKLNSKKTLCRTIFVSSNTPGTQISHIYLYEDILQADEFSICNVNLHFNGFKIKNVRPWSLFLNNCYDFNLSYTNNGIYGVYGKVETSNIFYNAMLTADSYDNTFTHNFGDLDWSVASFGNQFPLLSILAEDLKKGSISDINNILYPRNILMGSCTNVKWINYEGVDTVKSSNKTPLNQPFANNVGTYVHNYGDGKHTAVLDCLGYNYRFNDNDYHSFNLEYDTMYSKVIDKCYCRWTDSTNNVNYNYSMHHVLDHLEVLYLNDKSENTVIFGGEHINTFYDSNDNETSTFKLVMFGDPNNVKLQFKGLNSNSASKFKIKLFYDKNAYTDLSTFYSNIEGLSDYVELDDKGKIPEQHMTILPASLKRCIDGDVTSTLGSYYDTEYYNNNCYGVFNETTGSHELIITKESYSG